LPFTYEEVEEPKPAKASEEINAVSQHDASKEPEQKEGSVYFTAEDKHEEKNEVSYASAGSKKRSFEPEPLPSS
jgi:hypothetical protein